MSSRHRDCKTNGTKTSDTRRNAHARSIHFALEQLDAESCRHGIERRQLKRQQNAVLQPLKQIAAMDARMCELKQRRKALSRQLQEQLHAAYSLTNFSGQSLRCSIPGGSMPTGTGDVVLPKLPMRQHMASNH